MAWAVTELEDSDTHALQASFEELSGSARLPVPELEITSVLYALPSSDLYDLEAKEKVISDNPSLNYSPEDTDILYLAAPENLNPGLYIPPVEPLPDSFPTEAFDSELVTPDPETVESTESLFAPIWEVDGLTVNLSDDFSNFEQGNRIIEPTVTGTLPNGDRLTITPGFNRYAQPDVDTVFNIPLKAAWTGEMGDFTTTVGGGVDLFNQLPLAVNFNANTSLPIGQKATLSFFVDYGPYKFNATTLNNQIRAWRYGPNLYWQITPDMYLFSLVRWGRYNDGNQEQQSFNRIEKKLGDFYVAGNLFTWQYREDAESASGYFSPPDFLVANAEVGWKGEVLDWLDCGAAASWGRQRLNSSWSSAYSYNAKCTLEIAESLEMDLGYAFSNVIGQTGDSAFNNRAITGQVRAKF